MTAPNIERLHFVESTDWRDAIITLLDARSPYQPWRSGFGIVHEHDPVVAVLNTDPVSVVTETGRIAGGGFDNRTEIEWRLDASSVLEMNTLIAVAGLDQYADPREVWQLRGDAAARMETALREHSSHGVAAIRFGHSSMAAAQILLHSRGRCTGCNAEFDLSGEDAREQFHIRTVDSPPRQPADIHFDDDGSFSTCGGKPLPGDWPGVLCARCRHRMAGQGFDSLLEFRFAGHPRCPECWAQRAQSGVFGLVRSRDVPPWVAIRGCCWSELSWSCAVCGATWA